MAWMVVEVVDGPAAYSFQATVGGSGATGVAVADARVNFSRVEGRRPYPHIEEITPEALFGENPTVQKSGVLEPGFYIVQADASVWNPSCYPEPNGCSASTADANFSATITMGGS